MAKKKISKKKISKKKISKKKVSKKKVSKKQFSNAKKITAWSYSRYSLYKQCPLKARLKFIDKVEEPGNAAMARGSTIHDLAENYIKGSKGKMPKELDQFGGLFKSLRKQYKKVTNRMVVEDTWAFTNEWDQTVWNDWARCWVRIKLDNSEEMDEEDGSVVLNIRDWKTGKFREDNVYDYLEQLELYALAGLLMFEHVDVVKPKLYYLDYGVVYPEPDSEDELIFTRADIPKLKKLWAKRVKPMLNDTVFPARPNQYCYNCHYRKTNTVNNGGVQLCKY